MLMQKSEKADTCEKGKNAERLRDGVVVQYECDKIWLEKNACPRDTFG